MKLPWYRMYTEARTDFKLQTLTDEEHRVWFSLLCYAAERGKSGTIFLEAPENTKQENIQSPKNVGDRQKTPVIAIKMYTLAVECARANVDLLQRVLTKLMALDIVFFDATEVTFLHFQERQYDKPSNRPDAVKERRERQQAKKELLDSTPKNAGDRQKTPVIAKKRIDKIRIDNNNILRQSENCDETNCESSATAMIHDEDETTLVDAFNPISEHEIDLTPSIEISQPPKKQMARAANPYWDALVALMGHGPEPANRGAWGSAIQDIKSMGGTAADIPVRAENYRTHFPNIILTPSALAKHWYLCEKPKIAQLPITNQRYFEPPHRTIKLAGT